MHIWSLTNIYIDYMYVFSIFICSYLCILYAAYMQMGENWCKCMLRCTSIIYIMYEGYISCLVVARYLVMPRIRHVYVLLPLVMPHVRYVGVLLHIAMLHVKYMHLGLHIVVSLKGKTTSIWSLGCGFACATAMGYAGFRL